MKQKILLLHGALGTKDQFTILKEKLLLDFEVHDLDFEGHGRMNSNKEFTIDLFTENVFNYLNVNKIEKTHIFGFSMGGYVGLNVAIEYPNLVDKVITLGTKFDWTAQIAENEIKMLDPEMIEAKVPSFAKKLDSMHVANDWKGVINRTADMMLGLGNGEKITEAELRKIKHVILIGIGDKDRMVSIEESRAVAKILPKAKLSILKDFQHPIEKVNIEYLSSVLVDFIKK